VGLPIHIVSTSDFANGEPDSFLTVGGTLGGRALATTTTDAGTVDNVTLLGLVTQTASLVGAAGAGSAVDDVQLAELYESTLSKCSTSTPKHRRSSVLCRSFSGVGVSYLPAANAEQKAHHIALLLLLQLLEVLVGAHLCKMRY
jgi:hypothetical protein